MVPVSSIDGVAWPAIPGSAGAAMLALLWQLERSQWWARERLAQHALLQLRELVAHAVAHVPHYRDGLRAAGVGSAAELTWQSFARWPVLKKETVRANSEAFVARRFPPAHGKVLRTLSTGSTGAPMGFLHSEVAQFFAHALGIRDHLLHERDFSRSLFAIRHGMAAGRQHGWGLVNAVFATGPGIVAGVDTSLDEQLDVILRERPGYVLAYGSHLRALILHAARLGKHPRAPLQLLAYGDMPPADLRQLAREHWQAEVRTSYSCEEFSLVASQSPAGEHYLVHAENVHVEVLREDGSSSGPGETGRVVITGLHNFVMPLIRYDIGDYAQAGEPCPSGRGLPVLRAIVGRARNMLRHPRDGLRRPTFPADAWLDVAAFQQIRLVQHSLHEIEVQYVLDRELLAEECAGLAARLARLLDYPFAFRFTRMDSLQRKPGEKFEDFVCLIGDGSA